MEEFNVVLKPDVFVNLIIKNGSVYIPNSKDFLGMPLTVSNAQFLHTEVLPNNDGLKYTFYCDIKNKKVTKRYKMVLVTKYHQYYEGTAENCDEEEIAQINANM